MQMLSTSPTEKTAFLKQKLPTEIIGIICGFSDFKTHTAIRSTCWSLRAYVPLRKVVGFNTYKELTELYKIWKMKENEKRSFQDRIHLDLHHEELTQAQVLYLQDYEFDYELCRIARKVLDYPEAYKDIIFVEHWRFVAVAARVGDLEFLIQLLQVPLIDYAGCVNSAIIHAAKCGRLNIVQIFLQDPRADPSVFNNIAIKLASDYRHDPVVETLLQDPRVDPSCYNNLLIKNYSANGHYAIVEALLKNPRVDPSDKQNFAIIAAFNNGHLDVVKALMQDPRVDPSHDQNFAMVSASNNGHLDVVKALLQDPRVNSAVNDNAAIELPLDMDLAKKT